MAVTLRRNHHLQTEPQCTYFGAVVGTIELVTRLRLKEDEL